MTTPTVTPTVTATIGAKTVRVDGGDVTLDVGAIPYASAQLTLPLNADTALDDLDPRDADRVTIAAGNGGSWVTDPGNAPPVWSPATPRLFDLHIRERSIDHISKTVDITLASDEALLTDYAALTDNPTPRTHQASLRALVNYVLGVVIPGKTLEPGPDVDVTAQWNLTNYVTNPRAESTTGFTAGPNASMGVDTSTGGYAGQNYVFWSGKIVGETYIYVTEPTSGNVGDSWSASAKMRSDVAGTLGYLVLHFITDAGVPVQQAVGAKVSLPVAPGWADVTVSGKLTDARATKVRLLMVQNTPALNRAVGVDGITLTQTTEPVPYFSGASPTDARYVYAWTGAPDASTSTRTTDEQRPPEQFVWTAGVTAWDFLQPFLTSNGLRLACDELRKWTMIYPEDFFKPGFIVLSGANATRGTDTISRDDPDAFCTGVIVRYAWVDKATGRTLTAVDAAGDPGVVVVVDYARPYPGPGAAGAILRRRNGTGRTMDVAGLAQWQISPGMVTSITMPASANQQGKVASVRFSLADDALMSVGTTGLIDIPAGSWLAWTPTDQQWIQVPATVTWASL